MRAAFIILITACVAIGGLTLGANTAPEPYVGLKLGPVVPYLSLGFVSTSGSYTYHYESFNDNLPEGYKEDLDADTISWNVGLLSVNLGARVFLSSASVRPFLRASVGMPFPLYLKITDDDEAEQAQFDSLLAKMYEEPEPTITVVGGAGLEAFISSRISIAAEATYRYMFGGMLLEDSYRENEDASFWETSRRHADFSLGRLGAALWLNFYF